MTGALDEAAVARFRRDGFYLPVSVLGAEEVADLRGRLQAFEAREGGKLQPHQRNKSHLLMAWVDDLIRDSRILDPIEALIGPDILCWNTIFWIKEAGSASFVSWHQDNQYWGLEGGEVVTAWLALSPARVENGCMRVLPGSHREAGLPHADRYDENNMLTRGQEIAVSVDESAAVPMPLEPGQMSLHSVQLAHASGANNGADRRIGLAMSFMPTATRQVGGPWDSAALVRGTDDFGHFEHTPRLARDMDPDGVAFHERATAAVRQILYRGAERDTARL